MRPIHDVQVDRSWRNVRHIDNVVSGALQQRGQIRICAFVNQPAHAGLAIDESFIGQIVRRKGLRGANVVWRQPRMVSHDGFRHHAGSQLAQDDLDRHTRRSNHRLAAHDVGINFDSLMRHHQSLLSALIFIGRGMDWPEDVNTASGFFRTACGATAACRMAA